METTRVVGEGHGAGVQHSGQREGIGSERDRERERELHSETYLGVEVADVGGGILVALRGVLAQQVGAHSGRDARRHGSAERTTPQQPQPTATTGSVVGWTIENVTAGLHVHACMRFTPTPSPPPEHFRALNLRKHRRDDHDKNRFVEPRVQEVRRGLGF